MHLKIKEQDLTLLLSTLHVSENSLNVHESTIWLFLTFWRNILFLLIPVSTLRTTADKASKLESTVEVYRKKLQDLNDFRRQVKSLQETNMMYMHNTVSLEDELKKANAARAQLETYKRQVRLHLYLRSYFFLR